MAGSKRKKTAGSKGKKTACEASPLDATSFWEAAEDDVRDAIQRLGSGVSVEIDHEGFLKIDGMTMSMAEEAKGTTIHGEAGDYHVVLDGIREDGEHGMSWVSFDGAVTLTPGEEYAALLADLDDHEDFLCGGFDGTLNSEDGGEFSLSFDMPDGDEFNTFRREVKDMSSGLCDKIRDEVMARVRARNYGYHYEW